MTATLFPLVDDRERRLLAGEAVVVNVGKGRDPLAAWAIERGLLVYIGAGVRGGWRESVFHNPFRLQDHGRDEAIALYRENLESFGQIEQDAVAFMAASCRDSGGTST